MTFLDPIAGLIGAAASVPVLVLLYFLKLRRKPLRVSSTLLWEQAVKDVQANVPLKWLRLSWLLLLQLLALGALLAALARPAVPGLGGVAKRTLIVIDRSASMNATDALTASPAAMREASTPSPAIPTSRLEQARRAARELVAEMRRSTSRDGSGARSEAMLVALGSRCVALTDFTSDPRTLLDAIDAFEPTDQAATLDPVLELVRAQIAHPSSEEAAAEALEVIIISDGGLRTARTDAARPTGAQFRFLPVGPSTSDTGADNLGIVALAARRDPESPGNVRVFARVANASARRVQTQLTCRVDDQGVGIARLDVPGATRDTTSGALLAGEATASFELSHTSSGLVRVMIAREDVLAADNIAAVVVESVQQPRVLLVGPGPEPSDPFAASRGPQGVDRFLLEALRSMDLKTIDVLNLAQYEALWQDAGPAPALSYDLVFFDRAAPSHLPRVSSVHIASVPPGIGASITPFADTDLGSGPTRFVLWNRSHPLMRGIPLDGVLISPPMNLTLSELPGLKASVLAEGAQSPLLALIESADPSTQGARRLIVACDLLRTNWGGDVSFPVFVGAVVEFLGGMGGAGTSSRRTDESWTLTPASGATSITIRGPIERRIDVPAGHEPGASLSVGELERAGVYSVEGATLGSSSSPPLLAANVLSPSESNAQTARELKVGESQTIQDPARSRADQPKREIWWVFVLVAIGLLWVEWFVFARSIRV